MKNLSQKLVIGDYYQYFNYPMRKQIIQLYKNGNGQLLEEILCGLIEKDKTVTLSEDIQTVTIFDEQYPPLLLESYDPPLVLYCKGNLALLNERRKIAIVGSRTPQGYSLESTKEIIHKLNAQEKEAVTIVSGLAKGIDGYSHQLALDNQLHTIAVLGFGFNYMYPKENEALAAEINKVGLLITEYPPHIGINKWQFVARNRIISGLCPVVVVVEAKEKSGSLITAELALSENREVYIVSGKGFDEAYYGSHQLIQEGAKLLLNIEEVLAEYKVDRKKQKVAKSDLS